MTVKVNKLKFQRTIDKEIYLSGKGIHTGCFSNVTLKPAASNHGIKFKRIDLNDSNPIDASIDNVIDMTRGTTLGCEDIKIHTVEHLLAAISGLEIDNVLIEVDNIEIPILDGSAIPFVDLILESGIKTLDSYKSELIIDETIRFSDQGIDIHIVPSDKFRITFMMNYEHPSLGTQYTSFYSSKEEFVNNIAPARTFCLLSEVNELLDYGLIRGGDLNNALVFRDVELSEEDKDKIKKQLNISMDKKSKTELLNKTKLRFYNEPVRHKLLDLLGDVSLLGIPIRGHIIAARSGHSANIELVKMIKRKYFKNGVNEKMVTNKNKISFNIKEILNILPHRYPFLLIDKILSLNTGDKVKALKNVTINEPYFQGHFSSQPVVPGVLLIESMAQAGGFIVLNSIPNPEKKLMYISTIDKTKFKKVVVPGDQMIIEAHLIKFKLNTCKIEAYIKVNDEIVSESTFMATVVDRES